MENKPTHTNHLPKPFLWSLCLLTAAIIFKLFNQLYADYDLWWHIFVGNEIITNKTLGKFDVYSFTAFGKPYINHEWISEIIMAWAFLIDEDIGLIVLRWSMVLIILFLAFRLIKLKALHHVSRIITVLCFSIVLSPGISFRVQLFSYLLLLALLFLIYSARVKDQLPSVFVVSIFFVLWANLHGAFFLGLIIWFIYVVGYFCQRKHDRGWHASFSFVFLPLVATLINPYGPNIWKFIYHELSNPLNQKYITEWQRFSFAPREMPFFFIMAFTWITLFYSKRKKDVAETMILLFASTMGLVSVRHTPLFAILTLPTLARHMDGAFLKLSKRMGDGKPLPRILSHFSALSFIGISVFFFARGLPDSWQVKIGEDPVPIQTAAFLMDNHIKGNLWVPLHYGGYVLFHLYPDVKVSIDGRWAMVYPRSVMRDNMDFSFAGTGGKWKQVLEKYGANLAMVEAGNPAMKEMDQDLDWIWIFKETTGRLLIKKEYLPSLNLPLKTPQKKPLAWP